MSSQIFKNHIPNELLIDFLNCNAHKNDDYYIVNNNVLKKSIFNETIHLFIENCKPYYYLSKRKYLERAFTYTSFITIIRQICKYNEIKYTSQIKYDKSNYEIEYHIYI